MKNLSANNGIDIQNIVLSNSQTDHRLNFQLTQTNQDKLNNILHVIPTTGTTWHYIGFHNSLSASSNIFQFNYYTHVKHNGGVQEFFGSTGKTTVCLKVSQYSQNITINGISYFSDRSVKNNIEDIDENECMNLLENIKPKTYERSDLNNQKRVGFIANDFNDLLNDDMKSIVESIKDNNGDHQLYGLDYPKLTTILWSVCQQLNERIKALEGNAI